MGIEPGTSRGKNNFQDHDFFRVLKFPALFFVLNKWEKGREISKAGKNRGLESCSNIFFPLGKNVIVN